MSPWFVVGGRGFIGTNLAARRACTTYDLIDGQDAHDFDELAEAMHGHDTVVHLASNADIAAGADDPSVDLDGIDITRNVADAARLCGVRTILYASGSGVYGRRSHKHLTENGPCVPSSAYGASKLASEAILSAYSALYGISVHAFRFANVVGPYQTHGVGFDFVNRLREDPARLQMRGDGNQTKPYIHVDDALNAVEMVAGIPGFHAWNVGPEDDLTVREIARLAIKTLGLCKVELTSTGGVAWAGDIPRVSMNTDKIRAKVGWTCRPSEKAMREALAAL